jgi:hypothetical protein
MKNSGGKKSKSIAAHCQRFHQKVETAAMIREEFRWVIWTHAPQN